MKEILKRKILIASDHAGFELKEALKRLLSEYDFSDIGPKNTDRVDYPDFARKLTRELMSSHGSVAATSTSALGLLICGSGIGMSIAANRVPGIRAALVENPVSARLAREHNDANVICLGSRFLAPEYAAEIARVFIETKFSKDPRHQARIEKLC